MGSTRTAAFHTLGCKLNFAETSTLARSLEEAGYGRVPPEDGPDVFVLNTCSVTENADKECRRHVRRFRRINPDAFIAVVGCYAQLKPKEIAAIPGVDLVLGAGEKFDLAAHLSLRSTEGRASSGRSGTSGEVHFAPIKHTTRFVPSYNIGERTRTFLKIQDGCDYFCSFCTIPLARGRSRSGTVSQIVDLAHRIADEGVKEIVLTGVNIGDFGRAQGESFLELITALDRVGGIDRFRISSIEPDLCSDAIIEHVAGSERFAPHLHLPLQSGSDAILRRMRRRYDTTLYAERVDRIKRLMPHACIGADVITGTPGETDREFASTDAFLQSVPVDYLHVFTYSERANTTAVRMEDRVPVDIRRQRTARLRILSDKRQRAHHDRHLGATRPVLFEREELDGRMLGLTDNYIRVSHSHDEALTDRIVAVRLERSNSEGNLEGTILPVGAAFTPALSTIPSLENGGTITAQDPITIMGS
ncbi:MAG: tRNA (N(6)-L-threonylcarbamoyladenosine(37)-C(2))-methylthiotransferase MtaB [Flavobacteriales bacterium]|nr:tRNA (N(6)-L-threonylcarbamoyladenosine(37)-C(2))-methylthiotransferase MtaB [Flavobacteriales bacterium]